jgi:hypothetical protein
VQIKMKFLNSFSLFISIILLSACSPDEKTPEQIASNKRLYAVSMTQNVFEQTLRDPSSVEYITKAYNRDNDAICFKYRAKNGLGGDVYWIFGCNGRTSAGHRKCM